MPVAIFKAIREVSSEDKVNCATNLLKNYEGKKWIIGKPGEKSAYIIIEMEEAYSIKGIDIGNEHSAFVEVSVGGPGCPREKFKDILITCSFMTPIESRIGTNPNRVRCFNRDALVSETAEAKWNFIKVTCTQPFNSNIRYGLSFIKVHVNDEEDRSKSTNMSDTMNSTYGFALRQDSSDSESECPNVLFQRWKASKKKETTASCSVPRDPNSETVKKPNINIGISRNLEAQNPVGSKIPCPTADNPDRNRDSLLYTDEDMRGIEDKKKKRLAMLEKCISADQARITKQGENSKKLKNVGKKNMASPDKDKNIVSTPRQIKPNDNSQHVKNQSTPSSSNQRCLSSSPYSKDKPKRQKLEKTVEYRPLHELLRGVVLVISGIQNPDRSDLRKKALMLGAKYKQDWDNTSTHLICAFKNTPKYNQVKGYGKIVKRNWIEDCYDRKKRLPWRRYALDSTEQSKPESEDEILDESLKPKNNSPTSVSALSVKPATGDENDDGFAAMYDNEVNHSKCISSGSDTEDELQKVIESTSTHVEFSSQAKHDYEASTEEEDYMIKRKLSENQVPIFKNVSFFVSDQISAVEKIKVEQYIEHFNGSLKKSVDGADYVITNEPVAHSRQFKGEMVKPSWIMECYDSELFIPTNRYLVT